MLAATALAATAVVFPAQTASAHTCAGTEVGNYFAGRADFVSASSYGGVSSLITVRTASYCGHPGTTTSGNFYSGWAMLTDNSASSLGLRYAQSGFDRTVGGPLASPYPRQFAQASFLSPFGPIVVSNFTQDQAFAGSSYTYWTKYDLLCNCLKMGFGNTQLLETSWSPFDYWFEPFRPEFLTEMGDYHNSAPGGSSNNTRFNQLKLLQAGTWSYWTPGNPGLSAIADDDPPTGPDWAITTATNTCGSSTYYCFGVYNNGSS